MKKIVYSLLAATAVLTVNSCDQSRLEIPQKGVTAYETFYQTDEDAEAALTAAYAGFATYVTGRGNAYIYTPFKAMLNNCGDDFYAAGSNFGDNDYMAALNEFRYDSGCEVINNMYTGLFLANYRCNLVIDNFKDGLGGTNPTATTKRCVAEARVMRAYIYFLLTALWDTPPFIDHVITDGLPYNADKDPDNPMSHADLLAWVVSECESAANDLDERKSTSDKDGAVKVTKGFAYALAGKANIFNGKYTEAKADLKKVIDSGKYALIPGEDYWQNFHIEGDGNAEKIFETNLEYNSGIGAWGGINQRSTWMEANIWGWRSDHFQAVPQAKYTGGQDGWGGLGVPKWFGDEFFENDGHSPRFDATLKHIDNVVYDMEYLDPDINAIPREQKITSKEVGIKDPKDGLYGQSFYLGFKQMLRSTDCDPNYGGNVRLNNNIVMRYAEVLLLYAEACLQSGDATGAKDAINQIQKRAGVKKISDTVDMNVLKKEKSYELWLEGSRFLDIVRWGDTDKIKAAGSAVPKLFDKLFRAPQAGESPIWENTNEADSRFYMVYTHEAQDAGFKTGYVEGKHNHFPYPMTVKEKNPNLVQNAGWE